jgi:5-methylcytosine-specific restriction endonuclease McrA
MSKKDIGWYREMWELRSHNCQECGIHLPHFSPMFISHIITKGSYPSLRNHPENFMIYCSQCHQLWEFGDRRKMKTYDEAMEIMDKLKREYYESR